MGFVEALFLAKVVLRCFEGGTLKLTGNVRSELRVPQAKLVVCRTQWPSKFLQPVWSLKYLVLNSPCVVLDWYTIINLCPSD